MKQPSGFICPDFPHFVCKPKKVIYDLSKPLKLDRFSGFLLSHGFVCTNVNPSFFSLCPDSHTLILLLYVDDVILTCIFSTIIQSFTMFFLSNLPWKTLRAWLFSWHSSGSLGLWTFSFTTGVCWWSSTFHPYTVKPISTPFVVWTTLSLSDGELFANPSDYWSIVGALQYLRMTHPDIAYAIHVVS